MALIRIYIDTSSSDEELKELIAEHNSINKVINFLNAVAGGAKNAEVKVAVDTVAPTSTLLFTDQPTNSQTFVIGAGSGNSTALVAKTALSGYTGLWFGVPTDGALMAANLAASINANVGTSYPAPLSAEVSGSGVIITAGLAGVAGGWVGFTNNLSNTTFVTMAGSTGLAGSDGTVTKLSSK